jgi:hypothetical protein
MELLQVSLDSYPVLYKMYWKDSLEEDKRIENNREHLSVLREIYTTYYSLTLDLTTLDEITYVGRTSPWTVVFKIAYRNNDGTYDYLWEYFTNWVSILNLNRY